MRVFFPAGRKKVDAPQWSKLEVVMDGKNNQGVEAGTASCRSYSRVDHCLRNIDFPLGKDEGNESIDSHESHVPFIG